MVGLLWGAARRYAKNGMNGGTSTGSVAVNLGASATCETNTVLSGLIEMADDTTHVRLDSAASLAWNAYKDLTIVITDTGVITKTSTITWYYGNVTGKLSGYNSTTSFTLTQTTPYLGGAVATVNNYLGASIDIDTDGDPTTPDDVYSGTISAYTSGGAVTLLAAPTRTSAGGITETYSGADKTFAVGVSTYIIYTRVRMPPHSLVASRVPFDQ